MARFLVTGAGGFLGRHLVTTLLADGHEAVALCRSERGVDALAAAGAEIRRGDVLDRASVLAAAVGCDGVFHAAGRVSRDRAASDELFRVHVTGTETTLDACRQVGVRRAVVVSTSGVVAVSRSPEVRDEDAPPPLDLLVGWPYYLSKLYAEQAALRRNGPDLAVVCVNPTLVLGPGDDAGSSTDDVVSFLEGRLPVIPGGGVAFVDVRDVATGCTRAMRWGAPGARYLLNAVNLSFSDFFHRLERASGVPAPWLHLPPSPKLASAAARLWSSGASRIGRSAPVDPVTAEMAQHYWYADASRARRVLGWIPRDPGETLADTIADLRARGAVWPRG